ncbi:MAG TPA: bifunctional tRNA (5-methylaminomethyl-2-thiouridine)(34)-methyltransferase MnmD/FAD-dependent 5-carboxymethylaminomethyl-2-thiouridine(34) oxidoreductase MnmC [Burkholderiaceae bacterium]
MKSSPIVPAALQRDADGIPRSAEYGDVYHPRIGALQQARHVFLDGNALPARWGARRHFVIAETGFGLGNNFLATWQAWRDDPARCERLTFVSIERHPLVRDDLRAAHDGSPLRELSDQLVAAWPPLTRDLHQLVFEAGRVRLLLALGDVQDWLPELRLHADAFYLDGFAPARNPRMWDERVCRALARLAAPGATLATWSAASALRADLTSAGFDVRLAAGIGGKRDITLATYAPRFVPRTSPSRASAVPQGDASDERRALIVGAGLAGCAAAWALAEHGWQTQLLDRCAHIASEASGNPAGLFHGIINADEGTHARFNRAAAFEAHRAVATALAEHRAAGSTAGLVRLEHATEVEAMRAILARLGLPPAYAQALTANAIAELAGIAQASPGWFYPSGGWVDPAGLARSFIERAGARVRFKGNTEVHALRRDAAGRWQALDAHGDVIAAAPVLVVANAWSAARLLPDARLPLQTTRGQLSWVAADTAPAGLVTRVPVAGAGYLLPPHAGRIAFGATSCPDDPDPTVRAADHRANLAQLGRLTGHTHLTIDEAQLGGRTAWRCAAPDRLPVVGAVPAWSAADQPQHGPRRLDQVRFVPRVPGLFVYTALGSRGITWSALGAQVLAAAIVEDAVAPLAASLCDAIDPARFGVRALRRSADV